MFATLLVAPVLLAASAPVQSLRDWPPEACIASNFKATHPGEFVRLINPEYPPRPDLAIVREHFDQIVSACSSFWGWDGRQVLAARNLFWFTYQSEEPEGGMFAGLNKAGKDALIAKIVKHVAGYTDEELEAVVADRILPSRTEKDERFIRSTFSAASRAHEGFAESWNRAVFFAAQNRNYAEIIRDRDFFSPTVDEEYSRL